MSSGDTLRLMLIKTATMNSQSPAWALMLRNVYSFGGGTRVSAQTFSVELFTNQTPPAYDEGGLSFMEIFGLDNDGDTKIDRVYVDFNRGLIFFPALEPFNQPYNQDDQPVSLITRNQRMYIEDDPSRLNTLEHQKYQMLVRYSRAEGSTARTYDLGAMQIIENSERIYINDRLLQRGTDYTLDYQFGQLTIRPGVEIPPNSEVRVDFEEVPLFQTGNTSLFGFHNEYEFDPQRRNYLTSTLFFQNVESVDRTFVRLGDEPKSAMLGELGGQFQFDSERFTNWLNYLPIFESRTPSRLNIVGGLAFSNPNPNTRGGVLIEDFETAKIENPMLQMLQQMWRISGAPKADDGQMELFDKRKAGASHWYDPRYISFEQFGFYEKDIFGEIEGRTDLHREQRVNTLAWVFAPKGGNIFERRESWRSLVYPVSETGVLGMDEREYIQLYVATGRDQGKLIIDFGQVNEDAVLFDRGSNLFGEHVLNTEDRNFDGRLDHDEDTGLDGVFGGDTEWAPNSGDLGTDDFYRPGEDQYPNAIWINSTEGNNKGQIGSNFDTEDLNNNGALDEQERVFRIEIDLQTLEVISPPGIFIPEADRRVMVDYVPYLYDPEGKSERDQYVQYLGADSWYLLRIPLPRERSRWEQYWQQINNPSLSNVMQVRLTVHDFEKQDTLTMAAMSFVGNRFKEGEEGVVPRLTQIFTDTLSSDSLWPAPVAPEPSPALTATGDHGTVTLNAVSTIYNNEYYPPPIIGETMTRFNRSGRSEDFTAQESAIELHYEGLQRNYEGWALKAENNQQSYLDYAAMSFFINGRQGLYDPKPTFFVRLGTDKDNFYEYSVPVDTGWAEISVPFDGFLALKDSLQGALTLSQIQQFRLDVKSGPYRIKGNPSLTKVAVLAVGVANESSDIPMTGKVWIDDVRLTDVIREFGCQQPGLGRGPALRPGPDERLGQCPGQQVPQPG